MLLGAGLLCAQSALDGACGARVLVDLLHGQEVHNVSAAQGRQRHLVLRALVSGFDDAGVHCCV